MRKGASAWRAQAIRRLPPPPPPTDPVRNSRTPPLYTTPTPPQVALRGTVLRNTVFVAGIVAYTGSDTKIMQNANVTPSKRSRIDRIVNKSIFVIFITLLVLCIANASAWMMWRAKSVSDGW